MKNNIHHPKTIKEAIDDLQSFLESDMWHCFEEEFANEDDLVEYLEGHFNILHDEIRRIGGIINGQGGEDE